MRRPLVLIASMFVLLATGPALAGGIDNGNDFNAQKMRTLTRAASTEIDAAAYNPAGLTMMAPGFYASLSNLMVFDTYLQKSGDLEFTGKGANFVVPAAFLAYRQDEWAAYFAFTIPGGGGSAQYADGSLSSLGMANMVAAGLVDGQPGGSNGRAKDLVHSVEGSSMYLGFTFGTAVKLSDVFSLAAGVRHVRAIKNTKASLDFDVAGTNTVINDIHVNVENEFEEKADGVGGIIGLNITPAKGLNIGMRYESPTRLRFRAKQLVNEVAITSADMDQLEGVGFLPPGTRKGAEAQIRDLADQGGLEKDRDLPATASLGIAYDVLPALTAEVMLAYYFHRLADWDGAENHFHDNWETAFSLEYEVLPELKVSAGFNYAESGNSPRYYDSPETPQYSSMTVGLGLQYQLVEGLFVDVAYVKPMYKSLTTVEGFDLSQSRNVGALALTYKAF